MYFVLDKNLAIILIKMNIKAMNKHKKPKQIKESEGESE
jgi:hypothetical protein